MPNELIDREIDAVGICVFPHRCENCGEYIAVGQVYYLSIIGKESCYHCV